jgi:predicted nuclease of predicted toxin-antitoxin system
LKRLLLDQGCPRSTASILNNQGWQVLHVGDVGLSRATDTAILEHAHAENRVCVTLDADFHAILAVSGAVRPSTVRIRIEGLHADALAALLVRAWPHVEADLDQGALVTIDSTSIRVRRLPIQRVG